MYMRFDCIQHSMICCSVVSRTLRRDEQTCLGLPTYKAKFIEQPYLSPVCKDDRITWEIGASEMEGQGSGKSFPNASAFPM